MKFQLRLEWTDNFLDRDKALDELEAIWEEVEALGGSVFDRELVTKDVQQLPRQGGGHMAGLEAAASTTGELHSIVPDAGVIHPWDQGLWIFPEDHPLHEAEKAARDGDSEGVIIELEAAKKELMP